MPEPAWLGYVSRMSRTKVPSLRDLRSPASIAPRGASSVAASVLFLAACLFGGLTLAGCKNDGPLSVNRIEPAEGDAAGGTYVRIFGNRFTRDGARSAKIYFGSRLATEPRFASDTEMIVVAPPSAKVGEVVDVLIIFEPGGEKKMAQAFTYVELKKATVDDLSTKKPAGK